MKKIIVVLLGIFAFWFVFNFSPSQKLTSSGNAQLSLKETTAYANYGDASPLTEQLSDSSNSNSKWAHDVYQVTRALFNIVALIALFMFAFANILHIDVETYAIKKLLPKLIVATIFVNLAFPIFAVISRFIDTLGVVKMFRPLGGWGLMEYLFNWKSILTAFGLGGLTLGVTALVTGLGIFNIIGLGLAILVLLASTILVALLSMLLSFRPIIILIGVAIAPLAIAASLFPQTEGLYKKWLKIMAIWLFLCIMINFILQLVKLIP